MKLEITDNRENYEGDYKTLKFVVTTDRGAKVIASFMEGEPEDRTFYRDFKGVFVIEHLVRLAHEAGKEGKI